MKVFQKRSIGGIRLHDPGSGGSSGLNQDQSRGTLDEPSKIKLVTVQIQRADAEKLLNVRQGRGKMEMKPPPRAPRGCGRPFICQELGLFFDAI